MKTLKYILIIILSLGAFNSCLVDDTTRYDLNDKGPNLAGFTDSRTAFGMTADGNEYSFAVKMKLIGPTSMDMTSDIIVTVAPDEEAMAALAASDPTKAVAVEGYHYSIEEPSITLKKSDNYLGWLPITILTDGIVAPLAKTPVLILKVVSATGDPKVLNNGKPMEITLNYGCYSNLAGDYDVHTVITRTISGAVTEYDWTETISQTGVGEYRTQIVAYDGYVNPAPAGGTDGFTFLDVCNVITVPEQNLVDYYSNLVYGNAPGAVDPATGVITLSYTVTTTAAAGFRSCVSTYTPVGKK